MKVTLTKEQAEAIEFAKGKCQKEDIVRWHVDSIWVDDEKPLRDLSLDTLITALYVGYEVEMSPEEKIRNYFWSLKQNQEENQQKLTGLMTTLNLLGKKIEGVNC